MYHRIVLSIPIIVCIFSTPAYSGVQWKRGYDAAVKEAKLYNKPLMIDFYTTWCGWCKRLDRDVYTDINVITCAQSFINVKLDGDRTKSLVKKYGVSGYPTIIFLDPQEKVIGRIGGYVEPKAFLKRMKNALNKFAATHKASSPSVRSDDLKGVTGKTDKHGQKKSRAAAAKVMNRANTSFTAGHYQTALKYYKAVIDLYPDTRLAAKAQKKIESIYEKAEGCFEAAKRHYQDGDYKTARDMFYRVVRLLPHDSLRATTASQRLTEMESNKAIRESIQKQEAEENADALLQLADNYRNAGREDLAEEHYKKLLEEYPQSRHAQEAQKRLDSGTIP